MTEKSGKMTKLPNLRIIIVGCGKVGKTLVEQLSEEGHDITVIDKSVSKIEMITDSYDVMGLVGSGVDMSVLREAGVETADVLIAVTGSDEINLLCCTIAGKEGRDLAAIACVRNPEYSLELSYLREKLGLALVINPDLEAAREIARMISRPQALRINSFAKGNVELIQFAVPQGSVLNGRSLMTMNELIKDPFLLCAIERNGEVIIPSGRDELETDDVVTMMAPTRDVHKIFSSIGMKASALRSCMIIGGGKTSYYLAKQLLDQRMEVRIVETNKERADELGRLLPEAIVIHGNGSDESLLKEEGIYTVESFVAVTGIDEENILMSLYARNIPGLKTVTKINRITFNDVIEDLDLGSVVYPKHICAEEITAYVRARRNSIGSNVETLYHLFENRAEAVEFRIKGPNRVTGIPLISLPKKSGLLIACINRGGKIIIPRGQDTIEPGDSVIVVTTHTGFGDIEDILR